MIIVSRNKKCLTENINLYIKEHNTKSNKKVYTIENDELILAAYETEERAKEILDDITNTRAVFEIYKCSDANTQDMIDEKMLKENLIFDTYEMPEE